MVNQTEFWREVYKKSGRHRACGNPRVVPAFTIQALQENTVVEPPPTADPYKELPIGRSTFRQYYDRGMVPLTLESDGKGGVQVAWKDKSLEELDYLFYMPLLFDGLCEVERPYTYIVELGIASMLDGCPVRVLDCIPHLIMPMKTLRKTKMTQERMALYAKDCPERVLYCIPYLIKPLKKALDTKTPEILRRTMRILQKLVRSGNCVGEALVPHFRQILPVFGLLKDRQVNYGEEIDYSQQRGENVQDVIQETLEVLEQYGGEDAFINIKYMVPTYESCMRN